MVASPFTDHSATVQRIESGRIHVIPKSYKVLPRMLCSTSVSINSRYSALHSGKHTTEVLNIFRSVPNADWYSNSQTTVVHLRVCILGITASLNMP